MFYPPNGLLWPGGLGRLCDVASSWELALGSKFGQFILLFHSQCWIQSSNRTCINLFYCHAYMEHVAMQWPFRAVLTRVLISRLFFFCAMVCSIDCIPCQPCAWLWTGRSCGPKKLCTSLLTLQIHPLIPCQLATKLHLCWLCHLLTLMHIYLLHLDFLQSSLDVLGNIASASGLSHASLLHTSGKTPFAYMQ